MPSMEMLTVNEASKSIENILEIIWRALEYFPKGVWDEVRYLGNANIKHDVKIGIKGIFYKAFLFNNLIGKIRKIRGAMEIRDLLLAVTVDPVIAVYPQLEPKGISHMASLVRDYASYDVGIVSLFTLENDTAVMVTAHGLGHSRGLRHHSEPIDLMYEGLLGSRILNRKGFCRDCLRRVTGTKRDSIRG
ncbi:MAG: hypothetical protein QXS79_06495 [Candidatus Bathyarchaeia archaeon]